MVKIVIMIQVSAPLSQKEERVKYIVTVRNSSCGKVLFSQVSVCSQGGCIPVRACMCVSHHVRGRGCLPEGGVCLGDIWPGGCLPGGVCLVGCTPPETASAADGTHPTGMHSCY